MSASDFGPACRTAAGLLAAGMTLASAHAADAAKTPPRPGPEDYARWPAVSQVVVSPSNTRAVMLVVNASGRYAATVVDLAAPAEMKAVATFGNVDVVSARWVNDSRLVYDVREPGYRISMDGFGTVAVDIDGGRRFELISGYADTQPVGTRMRSRVLPWGWHVAQPVDEIGDEIWVRHLPQHFDGKLREERKLARLDTGTGMLKVVATDLPPDVRGWVVDQRGEPRLATQNRDGRQKLYWRDPGGSGWTVIEDHEDFSGDNLQPLFIEADGTVIVASTRGRETVALFTYDPRTRKLGPEPLLAVSGYDIDGGIEYDRRAGEVVGVHGLAAEPFSVWFDEGLAQVQKQVDAGLPPGRVNRLLCGRCKTANHFVVHSSSDRQSGEYHIYDRQRRQLRFLAEARPWLPEASQGRRSFHRVAARDGLSMPVVVTHPPGSGEATPLPAVVLVHGGPWVRGATREWDAEPQFLASRGYRVIEVDFRGSAGLGGRHFHAGWHQWGLAMQDDLVDALDWAVAQRLVDPQRVCIAGTSYGGYAALMGPVRHPGRYRCAASYAGVTDLQLMFSEFSSDIPAQARRYSQRTLLGDPEKDAERLRLTSPLHRVRDLKVPVLLAQGGQDRRVTRVHADRFHAAARDAGVEVERVLYPDEGHGWYLPENHADFLRRLEALLKRTLAP